MVVRTYCPNNSPTLSMDLFSFQGDPSSQLYGPTNNPSIIWTDPLLALYERLPFRMSSSIAMTRLVCSIRALFYHFRLFKRPRFVLSIIRLYELLSFYSNDSTVLSNYPNLCPNFLQQAWFRFPIWSSSYSNTSYFLNCIYIYRYIA